MRVGEGPRQDFLAGLCVADSPRRSSVIIIVGTGFKSKVRADSRFNFKKDDVVFFRRTTHLAYPVKSRRK